MKAANKNSKGSMLIAILIIMLMVSAISLAIVRRTSVGTIATTDSRKGFSAYQASDQGTEKIINNIRILDGDGANPGKIPENTPASSVCVDGASCYDKNNNVSANVSDIFSVQQSGETDSSKRAISAPIPQRVKNPLSSFSARNGGTAEAGTFNKCNMVLDWTLNGSDLNLPIKNLELRYSNSGGNLNAGFWRKMDPSDLVFPGASSAKIENKNFNYGQTYYIAVKAKNKNNYALDSLYYPYNNYPNNTGVRFDAPSEENCTGDLGCLEAQIPGSEVIGTAYSCCGGGSGSRECYKCSNGWAKVGNSCVQVAAGP